MDIMVRGVGAECSEVEGIGGVLKLVLHPLGRVEWSVSKSRCNDFW